MNYFSQPVGGKAVVFSLFFLLCFHLSAQDPNTTEMSKVSSVEDKNLTWGPCPDFMPEGCNIAILHGDPTKKNADVFFKIPANTDIPNHWHSSAERMILVSGEMEVTYEGEETRTLKSGSYAYGPAEKPHSGRCGDAGPCILFIAFEKPLDAFAVKKE